MGNLNCQLERNKPKIVYMAKIFSMKLLVLLLPAEGRRKLGEEKDLFNRWKRLPGGTTSVSPVVFC